MMNMRWIILIVVALLLGSQSVFVVDEREQAILLKLGKIQRSDFGPGLHFKIPFINNVRYFERRLLTLDAEPERFLTSEKKDVIVDSFVKWRIQDLETFYKATAGGDMRRAALLLYQKVNDGLRSEFGKRSVQEVVAGERAEIMGIVTQKADQAGRDLGVKVVDVRVKRIDLPPEVSNSVYARMRAERERVARTFRSRGAEEAEKIRAQADRERTVLLAKAYRDAEILRGEGDAAAAETYATAYEQDPEFFSFYRSLDAYRNSFRSKGDLLIVDPGSEFFDYFKKPEGR
ncbi:MAG: protease modulator HflC [Gammaproteobacteria bacterium]|nr:MAG: protease modulator HflC [Gammaproteobacteria bacterium]